MKKALLRQVVLPGQALSDGPQERKGDTALKPSVKLVRYLAVLAPLTLGVLLSGCGGLLGAVDGEVPAPVVQVTDGGQPISQLVLSPFGGSRSVQVVLPAGATTFDASVISGQELINLIVNALSGRQQVGGTLLIEPTGQGTGTAVIRINARDAGGAIVATTDLTVIVQHDQGGGEGG
jgi:hypothetical protein